MFRGAVPDDTPLVARLEGNGERVTEALRVGAQAMASTILAEPIDLCWQPAVYITEPSPTDARRRSRPAIGQSRSRQPPKPLLVPGRPLVADAPRIEMRQRERGDRSPEGPAVERSDQTAGELRAGRSRWRTNLAPLDPLFALVVSELRRRRLAERASVSRRMQLDQDE